MLVANDKWKCLKNDSHALTDSQLENMIYESTLKRLYGVTFVSPVIACYTMILGFDYAGLFFSGYG